MSNQHQIRTEFGCGGFYRMKVRRPDGRVRLDTGWFPNLYTDAGLEQIGDTGINSGRRNNTIIVGSGNTPPAVGDVQPAAFVAATSARQGNDIAAWGKDADLADRYYVYARTTRRFAEGDAQGILAEVCASPANPPTNSPQVVPVSSRALIIDGNGNPTTITVLADEILDVTYEFRVYMPVLGTEASGTFDLSGTSYNFQHVPIGYAQQPSSPSYVVDEAQFFAGGFCIAYEGDPIAAGTGPEDSPTNGLGNGALSSFTIQNAGDYEPNSFERKGVAQWNLNEGNLPGGIRTVTAFNRLTGRSQYFRVGRTSDDAPIPKTAADELRLFFTISWARL